MKEGSNVQINSNVMNDESQRHLFGVVGVVSYYNPEVWVEVTWPNGTISAYEENELICLDKEEKKPLPEVVQPESGYDVSFVEKVIEKINDYHRDYLERHPNDWDCCGFSSVYVEFGRKKKVKDLVLGLGFDIAYKSGKESFLEPKFRIPYCGHQSLTYKEEIMQIICNEINDVVGEKVAYRSSYMD
ncbi:hypothetical protein assk_360 [Aeromonas phage Assk]|nr:hypothetical protein assk_360 [Aeromonas phage Assk]